MISDRLQYCFLLIIASMFLFFSCKKDKASFQLTGVNSHTSQQLRGVNFPNKDTGYAVGGTRYARGTIIRTTDGGNTWSPDHISDKIIFDVSFVNALKGVTVGLDGKIYTTLDGGNNWQLYQTPFWKYLHDIFLVNDSTWVAVGGDGYNKGVHYRTINSGTTWVGDTLDNELRSVFFTSQLVGYACGYGIISKTTDGGATWSPTSAKGDFFTSIYFPSVNIGYAVGFNGSILKTSNGGSSWDTQRNGNSILLKQFRLEAVTFINNQLGYAVGRDGLILKTEDGGSNWLESNTSIDTDLFDIFPLNARIGYIVGDKGRIFKYTN